MFHTPDVLYLSTCAKHTVTGWCDIASSLVNAHHSFGAGEMSPTHTSLVEILTYIIYIEREM